MEEWRRIGAIDKADNVVLLCDSIAHSKVIEIGCGEGALLEQLKERNFGSEYVGSEISSEALAILRLKPQLEDVDLTLMEDYSLDYPDRHFDLAILSHVIEHVEHPRKLIAEASRVAHYLFVEVPLERTIRLSPDYVEDSTGHINFYDRITIRRFLQTCGLTVIEQRITDTSKELVAFQFGRLGTIRHLIRRAALNVAPNLAQRIFVYHSAAVCKPD